MYKISKGYGTPEMNHITEGKPIFMSSEFPSMMNDKGETRGALVLFKLDKTGEIDQKFQVSVQYEDIQGILHTESAELELFNGYQDSAIRKGILLIHYTDFVKGYLTDRKSKENNKSQKVENLSRRDKIIKFLKEFQSESTILGDMSLKTEEDILNTLLGLEAENEDLREFQTMKVNQLRESLKKNGLDTKGTKDQLIERLSQLKRKSTDTKDTIQPNFKKSKSDDDDQNDVDENDDDEEEE